MSLFPGYVFKGKTYKTVNGLCTALAKDSGCAELSAVHENQIRAFASDRRTVRATQRAKTSRQLVLG